MLANPPFGVDWKSDQKEIKEENEEQGFDGRFGAGLPAIDDGAILFLQHMISKMKSPKDGGSRVGIVFSASRLFTGGPGRGEGAIRRWIIENDWLEAVIALPDQLFYNTGIFTYLWIVTNRKPKERRGKIQLINATTFFLKMPRSLGNKRNEIGDGKNGKPNHIEEITRLYCEFQETENCMIFDNSDFGYRQITIERPLRLAFQALPERVECLHEVTAFQNLGKNKKNNQKLAITSDSSCRDQQEAIIDALEMIDPNTVFKDRNDFLAALQTASENAGVVFLAPIRRAILAVLSNRNDTAAICCDPDGNPEPDPELRDYENVPLKESIQEYFTREVRQHVPDAWINTTMRDEGDGEIGKVGYNIPLTRYFYNYRSQANLDELESRVCRLVSEIGQVFGELTE
jgi:type I restriction enzyme M protein